MTDQNVPPAAVQAASPHVLSPTGGNVLVFAPRPAVPVPVPAVPAVPAVSTDDAPLIPFLDLVSDRQDVFPDDFAESLTYDLGLALGVAAGPGDHRPFAGFLTDARVLTRRRGLPTAARMMGVSLAGLRGFLDGAGYWPGEGASVTFTIRA